MEPPIKHFTSTTYVFIKKLAVAVMIWHPSLKTWLPPGGHLEMNESPEETALREILEEIGEKNVQLFPNLTQIRNINDEKVTQLQMPFFLIQEKIEENHFHMDWIFYAMIPNKEYKSPEGFNLTYFSKQELEMESNMYNNVKKLALFGFQILQNL